MLARTKLLSAAAVLTMAMAAGAASADELTAAQLDTVTAGAVAVGVSSSLDTGIAVASHANTGTSGFTVNGTALNNTNFASAAFFNPGAAVYVGAP